MTEIEFYRKALADYEEAMRMRGSDHGGIGSLFCRGLCFYEYTLELGIRMYDPNSFKEKLPVLHRQMKYSNNARYLADPGDVATRIKILKRVIKNYEKRSDPTVI